MKLNTTSAHLMTELVLKTTLVNEFVSKQGTYYNGSGIVPTILF